MSNPVRFLAVIALYKRRVEESVSFQTLQVAASQSGWKPGDLEILIYDNTPTPNPPVSLPRNIRYHSTGQNDGLADAFNFAIEIAQQADCDWLITLDQDTHLPPHFLTRIAEVVDQFPEASSVAAIVPQIVGGGRVLSPNWFWAGAIPRYFPPGFIGFPDQPTFAFNSASTLRISALKDIGGYCPWFWLDNCDSLLYYQLHRYGKRVFIAGDIQVTHDFSMLDKERKMTIARYRSLLLSESAFWDLAMNRLAGMERNARLIVRWCKQLFNGIDPAFRKETGKALRRRLFYSRAARLKSWKKDVESARPFLRSADGSLTDLRKRLSHQYAEERTRVA